MSKRLLLFRHAKSDWHAGAMNDHERPLTKRGREAARVMGRVLAAADQLPDLVVTSSAVRARTTVELAHEAGGWTCPIETSDALYDTDAASVLEMIRELPDSTDGVLLAGHEPTWSQLASLLISGGSLRFPTAALARLDLDVDEWRDVTSACGVLVWLLQPKFFIEGNFPLALPPSRVCGG